MRVRMPTSADAPVYLYIVIGVLVMIIFFAFPFLFFLVPVAIAVLYVLFRNQPCEEATQNAFFNRFRVGGHRGSPYVFPENSQSGFEHSHTEGVDLIEFDVALTKDGHAVLLHDDDLDRTTNMTGPIRDKTIAELAMSNVAHGYTRTIKNSKFMAKAVQAEGIPTLESVVAWAAGQNVKMLFDVKDYDPVLVTIIANLFEKYNLYEKAIVCSFYPWVVYRMKKYNQRVLTGLTWRQSFFSYKDLESTQPRYEGPKHYLSVAADYVNVAALSTLLPSFLGADMLLTNQMDISQQLVNREAKRGRRVCAWTVNDIREMDWMVNTLRIPVLTDYPHFIDKLDSLEKFHNK